MLEISKITHSNKINNISLPQAKTVEEKHEKHLQGSEPILSGALTPYEAFKEGFERAIASYLKLGNEGKTKKIVSEKPIKNIETELMEQLIKNLLKNFDSVKFIKKDGRYLAISGGKLYQFSNILEKTNFNLISLSKSDLSAYQKLLDKGKLYEQPQLGYRKPTAKDFIKADPGKLCRNISFAEKEAINIYTGSAYYTMNLLMRGQIDEAVDSNYAPANHTIKETLLHIAVAVSGLNKLPDFVPPVGADGKPQKYLYRAEGYLPESVIEERKWAVQQGGGITFEMGFMSTSYTKPVSGFFGEDTASGVLIKNLKGKKITPLSQFGNSEREVLLPPTQMQWKSEIEIITDIYKNTMHLFLAKPVTVNSPVDPLITKSTYVQTINPKDNLFLGIDTALV